LVAKHGSGRLMLPLALLAATLVSVACKQMNSPEVGIPWLYKGLITWAFFWSFLDAYTIGANDVANAFANSVGSGTLTHRSACLVACLFEFIGVVALGSAVTDTVRTKLIDVNLFKHDPYVLATGMSMVNVGSGLWVLCATFLSLPVSTTHAVVGAVIGVGLTAFGPSGVLWAWNGGGFSSVVASWFISPVLSGVLAATFYLTVKYLILVLPDKEAIDRGILLMPIYLFFAFGTIWGFLCMKGIPAMKSLPLKTTVPIIVGLGVGHAIFGVISVCPWLRRTIVDMENIPWYMMPFVRCIAVGSYGYYSKDSKDDLEKPPMMPSAAPQLMMQQQQPMQQPVMGMPGPMPPMYGGYGGPMPTYGGMGMPVMGSAFGTDNVGDALRKTVLSGFDQDIGAKREEDAAMHAVSFTVDTQVEEMFKFLQLSSCCFFSLSHGANDVANAVGPFAAVWMVYSTGVVSKKADVPIWILVYGACALDIGLLTMGHHIMAALGNRLTLQSPSRGFCIELGAMFTVMIASKLGIPVSTTHCITGATTFVGLCNGNVNAVNWKLFAVIFGGWIITCPMSGIMTGLIFWGIVSAPRPTPGNGFFSGDLPSK
jgi:phosphate/sulfate permease